MDPIGALLHPDLSSGKKLTKRTDMLVTLAVILIILWLLGLISSYTLGGFIHILLVLAIIALLVRFVAGRPGPPPSAP